MAEVLEIKIQVRRKEYIFSTSGLRIANATIRNNNSTSALQKLSVLKMKTLYESEQEEGLSSSSERDCPIPEFNENSSESDADSSSSVSSGYQSQDIGNQPDMKMKKTVNKPGIEKIDHIGESRNNNAMTTVLNRRLGRSMHDASEVELDYEEESTFVVGFKKFSALAQSTTSLSKIQPRTVQYKNITQTLS